jgi:hypothetical protein
MLNDGGSTNVDDRYKEAKQAFNLAKTKDIKKMEMLFLNCAASGETELCKMLVERGVDPYVRRRNGDTALHLAAQEDHVDACCYLVDECGLFINVECLDEYSLPKTPLYEAALNGNIEVCKYLLKKGAKVDAGRQPLTAAAQVLFCLISRMATRILFSFSWIMEQILSYRI